MGECRIVKILDTVEDGERGKSVSGRHLPLNAAYRAAIKARRIHRAWEALNGHHMSPQLHEHQPLCKRGHCLAILTRVTGQFDIFPRHKTP